MPPERQSHGLTGDVGGFPTVADEIMLAGRTLLVHRVEHPDHALDAALEAMKGDDPSDILPYWVDVWPSAKVLAEKIASLGSLAGKTALELGCGAGVGGLTASVMGCDVIFTDADVQAVALARLNVSTNALTGADFEQLDWREPFNIPTVDLVIGSDLLYETWQARPLARTIAQLLSPQGRAIVVDPKRNTAEKFLDEAAFAGLESSVEEALNPETPKLSFDVMTLTHAK